METCTAKIYGLTGESNKEYYLSITLLAEKDHAAHALDMLDTFLTDHVQLAPSPNGDKTHLVNIYRNLISLKYRDIRYQSENYKNVLRTLVKYHLLDNTTRLDPYHPMTWGEYIEMYTHMVYGYVPGDSAKDCTDSQCRLQHTWVTVNGNKTSIDTICSELNVSYADYIPMISNPSLPQGLLDQFDEAFHMKLAGVDNISTSRDIYYATSLINEKVFGSVNLQLEKFDRNLYGHKKILISQIISSIDTFLPVQVVEYDPSISQTRVRDLYSLDPLQFGSGGISTLDQASIDRANAYHALDDELANCANIQGNDSAFTKCMRSYVTDSVATKAQYDNNNIPPTKPYPVLTRAQAIDRIVPKIDFGLFDPELAKKKNTQIDVQSNNQATQ